MSVQWIDSKLLNIFLERYKEDAYSLLATYSILLKNRNSGHCYTPIKNGNNKTTKNYRLLSKETGISLNVIKRNVDILISEGLCHFTKSGGFFMLGKDSVNLLTENKKKKRIGIEIRDTLCLTKTSVRSVMVFSNIKQQQRSIDKKVALRKLKTALDKNLPLSSKQLKLRKALLKKGVEINVENMVQITTLSNNGFARTLKIESSSQENDIAKGKYWKQKLVEGNFIRTRRRYKTLWDKTMGYAEFLRHRAYFESKYGYVTYKNGRIVQPIVSEIGKYDNSADTYYNIYNSSIYNTYYNTKEIKGWKDETSLA